MLKHRVISGVIVGVIVIGDIFWLDRVFVELLVAIVLLLATRELVNMTLTREKPLQWVIALLGVGLFVLAVPYVDLRYLFYLSYAGLLLWLLMLVYLFHYRYSGEWRSARRLFFFLLTFIMLWISLHGLYFIHGHFEFGAWLLLYMLTLVWVADTGAYFAGRKFGLHKLAPTISPGKTWEGVFGGLLLNAVWVTLVYFFMGSLGMAYWQFLLVGMVTSALSVVGDLYESILKREAGLKDSGSIMPGHGGAMDRIDSIVAATPVFISGLYLFGAI